MAAIPLARVSGKAVQREARRGSTRAITKGKLSDKFGARLLKIRMDRWIDGLISRDPLTYFTLKKGGAGVRLWRQHHKRSRRCRTETIAALTGHTALSRPAL